MQKISLFHVYSSDKVNFRVLPQDYPYSLLTIYPKNVQSPFNLYQYAQTQLNPLAHFWDTANFIEIISLKIL